MGKNPIEWTIYGGFFMVLNRNQEIIISEDGISYGPKHEMTNEEKVVRVVGDRKGHVELFYDYHTSSWKSYLFDKRRNVISCSTTEEDGHYTIDESLGALLLNINQKLQE
jgi:hypothetical protein